MANLKGQIHSQKVHWEMLGVEGWAVSIQWGQSFSLGRGRIWELDDGENFTTM